MFGIRRQKTLKYRTDPCGRPLRHEELAGKTIVVVANLKPANCVE